MMNFKLVASVGCVLLLWMTVSYITSNSLKYSTFSTNSNTHNFNTMYADFVPIPHDITSETTVAFYAHGDVPYTRIQARKLKKQMLALSDATNRRLSKDDDGNVSDDDGSEEDNAEFMIHVGDIRMGGPQRPCLQSEYENVASLLQLSPVPVFIILGDNDVHDCPDPIEGLQLWRREFASFESRYWNHTFAVVRPTKYPENFTFQHKNALFIGVNVVGERTNAENIDDVTHRLSEQVEWVMDVILKYQEECILQKKIIGRVVIFYHANPGPHTRPFFKPLRHFIGNDLNHSIPILFVNGDAHKWMYQPRLYNETSLLRITVTGLAVEPLVKVTIPMDGIYHDPTQAYVIDRRLPASYEEEEH
jgi:hypothetical protein